MLAPEQPRVPGRGRVAQPPDTPVARRTRARFGAVLHFGPVHTHPQNTLRPMRPSRRRPQEGAGKAQNAIPRVPSPTTIRHATTPNKKGVASRPCSSSSAYEGEARSDGSERSAQQKQRNRSGARPSATSAPPRPVDGTGGHPVHSCVRSGGFVNDVARGRFEA